jgi:hypothetical protein
MVAQELAMFIPQSGTILQPNTIITGNIALGVRAVAPLERNTEYWYLRTRPYTGQGIASSQIVESCFNCLTVRGTP